MPLRGRRALPSEDFGKVDSLLGYHHEGAAHRSFTDHAYMRMAAHTTLPHDRSGFRPIFRTHCTFCDVSCHASACAAVPYYNTDSFVLFFS
jgi:hypothetical protein